jgi:hypothetical protein
VPLQPCRPGQCNGDLDRWPEADVHKTTFHKIGHPHVVAPPFHHAFSYGTKPLPVAPLLDPASELWAADVRSRPWLPRSWRCGSGCGSGCHVRSGR